MKSLSSPFPCGIVHSVDTITRQFFEVIFDGTGVDALLDERGAWTGKRCPRNPPVFAVIQLTASPGFSTLAVSRLRAPMIVSRDNSKAVYQGIKDAGIRSLSALPETWLVYLLQLAENDPEMTLIEVAKEEEAIGIAAGAWFAGTPHALLMQNHGFLAAINGIVSLAMLYRVPMLMLIALRGHMGEPYPWHTQGGIVTEPVLRALGLPFEYARDPARVGKQIREAYTLAHSALSPVALLLTRDLMED